MLWDGVRGWGWDYSGTTLALLWYWFGITLVLVWYYSGTELVLLWYWCGTTLVLVWYYSDTGLILLWYCYGSIMVLLWYWFCTTMVMVWYYYGTDLILLWYWCGTTLVLVLVLLWYWFGAHTTTHKGKHTRHKGGGWVWVGVVWWGDICGVCCRSQPFTRNTMPVACSLVCSY